MEIKFGVHESNEKIRNLEEDFAQVAMSMME